MLARRPWVGVRIVEACQHAVECRELMRPVDPFADSLPAARAKVGTKSLVVANSVERIGEFARAAGDNQVTAWLEVQTLEGVLTGHDGAAHRHAFQHLALDAAGDAQRCHDDARVLPDRDEYRGRGRSPDARPACAATDGAHGDAPTT